MGREDETIGIKQCIKKPTLGKLGWVLCCKPISRVLSSSIIYLALSSHLASSNLPFDCKDGTPFFPRTERIDLFGLSTPKVYPPI